MKGARKRNLSGTNGSQQQSEKLRKQDAVAKENQNSNHAKVQTEQEVESSARLTRKSNRIQNREGESSQGPASLSKGDCVENVHKAQFNEDDDVVDMEVQGAITSDGEVDSGDETDSNEEEEAESQNEHDPEPTVNNIQEDSDRNTQTDNDSSEGEEDQESRRKRQKHERKQIRKARRESMEQQLQTVSSSLKVVQELLEVNGLLNNPKQSNKGNTETDSVATIYKSTVPKAVNSGAGKNHVEFDVDPEISFNLRKGRDSSSSEDQAVDTSDELMEVDVEGDFNDRFIAGCRQEAMDRRRSCQGDRHRERSVGLKPGPSMEEGEQIIRQAETNKANLYATPGINNVSVPPNLDWLKGVGLVDRQNNAAHAAASLDENYLVVGSHIDATLQQKIIHNEYVDFAKLLPKNGRIAGEEDHRMELISKGGYTYFVPVSDRETSSINGFSKWEQAFRIFSNIYTRAYPHKAMELIQYNHIIYTVATTYVWENVYKYDREFRMHLSNFPQRSWSVILQQAWAMYLKDKINKDDNKSFTASHGSAAGTSKAKSNENCRRYNKGTCHNGASCHFQHRCDECGKFGHGAHICHKRKARLSANQSHNTNVCNNNEK